MDNLHKELVVRDLNYRITSLRMEIHMDIERAGSFLMGQPGVGQWDGLSRDLRKIADKIDKYLWLEEVRPLVEALSEEKGV